MGTSFDRRGDSAKTCSDGEEGEDPGLTVGFGHRLRVAEAAAWQVDASELELEEEYKNDDKEEEEVVVRAEKAVDATEMASLSLSLFCSGKMAADPASRSGR